MPLLSFASPVRVSIVLLLAATCSLNACGGSDTKPGATAVGSTPKIADEAGLRALADQQLQYSKSRDWARLYATYSPEVRAACSETQFATERDAQIQRGFDPAKVAQTIASIRADGDHAYITWEIAYGGTPVAGSDAAAPDAYVRIDGRWYDAPDANTGCSKPATPAFNTPLSNAAPKTATP